MRIVCVGHTAFDRVFMLERVVDPPAKVAAHTYMEMGGGMAANGAVAVAHLGGEVEFWGPAGDDAVADAMAADFARHGVDCRHMHRIAGAASSHSVILVDAKGERLIVSMRGSVLKDPGDWMPLGRLAHAGALLADVRWPAGSKRAMIAAREAGVPTVLDGDTGEREVLRMLVAHADYAVFSEPGFAGFTDAPTREGLREALVLGARVAVVTRGERGCEWIDGREPDVLHQLPAFPARAVDTTGAGDAFHGAFTLRIAEGAPLGDALRFASAAGALKVARAGARSMPSRQEVETRLGSG